MKTLFKYLAAAFLFCVALNANAQFFGQTFHGSLSFNGKLAHECPAITQGDSADVAVTIFFGDGIFRQKMVLGDFAFNTTTTSGVPVSGVGTFIGNLRGGSLEIHELTIGDPPAGGCDLSGLNIKISMKPSPILST